jgi:hypothetical protein
LRLEEDDRMLGNRRAGFLGVIDVVEADGDELRRRRDARAQTRLALDRRKAPRVEPGQFLQLRRGKRRSVDVADLFRQVAQLAVGIDQSRFFLARGAIAYEFHIRAFIEIRLSTLERGSGGCAAHAELVEACAEVGILFQIVMPPSTE